MVETSISPVDVAALMQTIPDDVNLASASPDAVVRTNIVQDNNDQVNPVVVEIRQTNAPVQPNPPQPQQDTLIVPHGQPQSQPQPPVQPNPSPNPTTTTRRYVRPANLTGKIYTRRRPPTNGPTGSTQA